MFQISLNILLGPYIYVWDIVYFNTVLLENLPDEEVGQTFLYKTVIFFGYSIYIIYILTFL